MLDAETEVYYSAHPYDRDGATYLRRLNVLANQWVGGFYSGLQGLQMVHLPLNNRKEA